MGLVESSQVEMRKAIEHLDTLCSLKHVDKMNEAKAKARVSHIRTKQNSLRKMYDFIAMKLSYLGDASANGRSFEIPVFPGFLPGEMEKQSSSDSVAFSELDATACEVEIMQQQETVNELLRFT